MKYITIITSIVKILFTVCIFIFINKSDDFWLYPVFISLGSFFSLVLSLVFIIKLKMRVKLTFTPKEIKKEITSNFSLFLNSVTPMLYNNTTQVLMGVILETSTLGLFDAIRKIPMIVSVFIQVVSNTVFPYFNRKKKNFEIFKKYLLIVYLGIIVVAFIFHPFFFKVLSISSFRLEVTTLVILLFGMIGVALSNVYGTNYLLINLRDRCVLNSTIIASLLGFILAYPLIVNLGMLGGAINITLSQIVLGGLMYYYYRQNREVLI